jgi:cytochrome c556
LALAELAFYQPGAAGFPAQSLQLFMASSGATASLGDRLGGIVLEGTMRTNTRRKGAVVMGLAAVAWALASATASSQTVQTRQVMREKLELSEILLGAVVTGRWPVLAKNTQALVGVTTKPGWQVFEGPEYVKQTRAFLIATQALTDAAEQRDQRAAVTAYNGLVASCVECHRYVARMRIAR